MKKQMSKNIGLCLSLLGLWPGTAAAADAVITWNEYAAKAATAACLHISGNGLAESRMYAMVHVAVHDAVNAIDRRSRPYAFDANVNGPVSVDAAVAAAARDVLVSVIAKLPESPAACVASGILEANALYAAALMPIPNGPAKTAGVAVGQRRGSRDLETSVRHRRWVVHGVQHDGRFWRDVHGRDAGDPLVLELLAGRGRCSRYSGWGASCVGG